MKTFLLSILFVVVCCVPAVGRQLLHLPTKTVVTDSTGSTIPGRTIEESSNGVFNVTYTFDYAMIDSVSDAVTISFESFGTTSQPGAPVLPTKIDAFQLALRYLHYQCRKNGELLKAQTFQK